MKRKRVVSVQGANGKIRVTIEVETKSKTLQRDETEICIDGLTSNVMLAMTNVPYFHVKLANIEVS